MDAGTDPADPEVRRLADRWTALAAVFLGDQAEFRPAAGQAWQAMWAEHPETLRSSPSIAPPEMWRYIQQAQSAR